MDDYKKLAETYIDDQSTEFIQKGIGYAILALVERLDRLINIYTTPTITIQPLEVYKKRSGNLSA